MKKIYRTLVPVLIVLCVFQSCATVFGGATNTYQRTRPLPGQEQRRLRVGAFVADLFLFWPGLIVDFATCAIYRPTPATPPLPAPAMPAAPAPSGK